LPVKPTNLKDMKTKLVVLAMAMFFLAQTASAQQGRANRNYDNNRTALEHTYNRNHDEPDYGTRRVRNNHGKAIINDRTFKQALVSIRRESFDSDKMKLARLILSRNNMTTDQISTMARLFSFDSSKLAFTKMAYASCIDQQNYYVVSRVFAYSSSRRELYDYLARV
jgi:hypothetical protein